MRCAARAAGSGASACILLPLLTLRAEYRFAVESSKWPYPDSLSVSIPITEKNLLGTDSKLEIVRVAHPRVEEYVIKGPDARAVRYAGTCTLR